MIIIIEGIDRVGKTTLANKLSIELGIPIFKKSRVCGNNAVDEKTTAFNYGNATGLVDLWNWKDFKQDMIVDRFHWTESVYSQVDRHLTESKYYMGLVEERMLLRKNRYLMIYMRPTSIERSSEEHGSDLSEHLKLFDELASNTKLGLITSDYNQIDTIVNIVKELMKCQDQTN